MLREWKVEYDRLAGTSPKVCAISIAKRAPVIDGAVAVSGKARTQASGEISDAMPSAQPLLPPRLFSLEIAPDDAVGLRGRIGGVPGDEELRQLRLDRVEVAAAAAIRRRTTFSSVGSIA